MAFKNHGELTKEQAAKRNYFDMFGRHFTDIVEVSLIYFISNIIFFGLSAFLFIAHFGNGNLDNAIISFLTRKMYVLPILPFVPLMLTGPFTAGFTYVVRNYAKQEHAFVFSDFFAQAKSNLKQGLMASVLTYLVMYLLIQALFVYNSYTFIPRGFVIGVFLAISVLLIIMSFYVYPQIVTFRMSFKTILKNSWTFTIMKLPQNLLIFALLFAVHGILLYALTYLSNLFAIYIALFAFILTGFTSFTANYYVWHVLDKYIVSKVTTNKNNSEENDD